MNDDSRWKANMSLRDQLLINAPPSTSSSDVDDTSHSNYKETPSFPLWGDSFNHDQQRVGAAVQDFPIFQGGGLYSVVSLLIICNGFVLRMRVLWCWNMLKSCANFIKIFFSAYHIIK